jgi:hypothetical protein
VVTKSRIHRSLVGGLLAVAAGSLVVVVGVSGAAGSTARAARTISLNDSAHLHRISSHGFKLYETGQATGTIKGTIYLHLNVTSTNRVTAEISVYPKGSSMTGTGTASYHVVGGTANFSGTMSIVRGTGRYAHAHGSGLHFSGTIQRSNDAVTVHVSGKLSV